MPRCVPRRHTLAEMHVWTGKVCAQVRAVKQRPRFDRYINNAAICSEYCGLGVGGRVLCVRFRERGMSAPCPRKRDAALDPLNNLVRADATVTSRSTMGGGSATRIDACTINPRRVDTRFRAASSARPGCSARARARTGGSVASFTRAQAVSLRRPALTTSAESTPLGAFSRHG